jgi:hypothetical protein
MPLVSGGGYFDMGVGFANEKNALPFVGISSKLYDSPGFLCQFQYPVSKIIYINGAMRYGEVEGVSAYGLSGGLCANF